LAQIRVAIIDDHALVANAFRHMLESVADYEVVGVANSGGEGLLMMGSTTPDVVLLDLRLPDMSGVELIGAIRNSTRATKVIVVSVSDDPVTVAMAMEAGIHGYVVKTSDPASLVDAIRTAHEGSLYLDEPARRAYEAWSVNPHKLTDVECQLLRLVAKGLDQRAIAEAMSVSVSTLKRQLRSITTKLDATNSVDAALEATRRGLI
jgi:DNA-binding NarL/FixJ family response regulator